MYVCVCVCVCESVFFLAWNCFCLCDISPGLMCVYSMTAGVCVRDRERESSSQFLFPQVCVKGLCQDVSVYGTKDCSDKCNNRGVSALSGAVLSLGHFFSEAVLSRRFSHRVPCKLIGHQAVARFC